MMGLEGLGEGHVGAGAVTLLIASLSTYDSW
jgi:hypothetical protein